jgi:hypothetical protein
MLSTAVSSVNTVAEFVAYKPFLKVAISAME